jgi:hypothetical protein
MTYSTPELRKLGSLSELTLGVGSRNGDKSGKSGPKGGGSPQGLVGGIAG